MRVKLGEVCEINPKSPSYEDDFEVSFVPMPKVSETGDIDASEIKAYSEVKKGFTYFAEQDVLFAKITPCMENGKGAIAIGLKNGVGFGSTEFHVLRPQNDRITSEWLYYLTSWSVFRKECEKNMTGSAGQKRVPKNFLDQYCIDLPSMKEQQKQTAILDKVSDLIAMRKKQLQKLDDLVKSRFVEMFGDESNFPQVSLSNILVQNDITEKITNTKKEKFVTLQLYGKGAKERIIKDGKWPVPFSGYRIKGGQFIYSRIDARNGAFAIVPDALNHAVVSKDFPVFFVKDNLISKEFLLFSILQTPFIQQVKNNSFGATNRQRIQEAQFLEYTIALPPMAEQETFATYAKVANKSKLTIQQSLDKLELMKKALMQTYFG